MTMSWNIHGTSMTMTCLTTALIASPDDPPHMFASTQHKHTVVILLVYFSSTSNAKKEALRVRSTCDFHSGTLTTSKFLHLTMIGYIDPTIKFYVGTLETFPRSRYGIVTKN